MNAWFAESLHLIMLAFVHYNGWFKWLTRFRNVDVHSLTQALQNWVFKEEEKESLRKQRKASQESFEWIFEPHLNLRG